MWMLLNMFNCCYVKPLASADKQHHASKGLLWTGNEWIRLNVGWPHNNADDACDGVCVSVFVWAIECIPTRSQGMEFTVIALETINNDKLERETWKLTEMKTKVDDLTDEWRIAIVNCFPFHWIANECLCWGGWNFVFWGLSIESQSAEPVSVLPAPAFTPKLIKMVFVAVVVHLRWSYENEKVVPVLFH